MKISKRNMLYFAAAIGLFVTAGTAQAQQLDLGLADDDVWAHIRAGDPGGDPLIRCWGTDGYDINPTGYPGSPGTDDYFSYGYVKWDINPADLPPDYSWNGLTLTITIGDGSTLDPAQDTVYVRGITGPFDEDTWTWGDPPAPIASARLAGVVNGNGSPGDTITFSIPRNIPNSILGKWSRDRAIYLMVSTDASFIDTGRYLRFATNNNLIYDGPQLVLD